MKTAKLMDIDFFPSFFKAHVYDIDPLLVACIFGVDMTSHLCLISHWWPDEVGFSLKASNALQRFLSLTRLS